MFQSVRMEAVSGFLPITLSGLDGVKLLNRVDTKYVFNLNCLGEILAEVNTGYRVLEIDGKRVFHYESVYFDTADFTFYKNHHNGKPNRVKVRYRRYTDTGEAFFEVKKKIKGTRTDKSRIKLPLFDPTLSNAESELLKQLDVNIQGLEEKVRIYYDRITLASVDTEERVTIDLNLEFIMGDKVTRYPNLVIAEVKQPRISRLSSFAVALRNHKIPKAKISKYTMAIAMLYDEVKRNAFKNTINRINKIAPQ